MVHLIPAGYSAGEEISRIGALIPALEERCRRQGAWDEIWRLARIRVFCYHGGALTGSIEKQEVRMFERVYGIITSRIPVLTRAFLLIAFALYFPLNSCGVSASEGKSLKALIIALNDYSFWTHLDCPRDDAELFKKTLIHCYNASEADICLLPEKESTKSGIEKALRELVERAQPGDTIVMLYAGHGAVVVDETYEEADGLSGCIVPIDAPDYKSHDFSSRIIRDSFMEEILAELVKKVRSQGKEGSILFVFDCCHSGSMSRGELLADEKIRSARGVYDFMRSMVNIPAGKEIQIRPHKAGSSGWITLSACKESEEARDNPSFSKTIVTVLEDPRLTATSTFGDLMQLIGGAKLMEKQTPQCEGDINLPVLGGTAQPRTPSIKITHSFLDSGGTLFLELDKGTLSGITPGSVISVFTFGTTSPSQKDRKLGDAIIEREDSGPYQAVARWKGLAGVQRKDLTQAVAWLTDPSIPTEPVHLLFAPDLPRDSCEGLRQMLKEGLKDIVQEVPKGKEADLFLFVDSKGPPMATLEALHTFGGEGKKTLLSLPPGSPGFAEALSKAIKAYAQKAQFLRSTCSPQEIALSLASGSTQPSAAREKRDPFLSLRDGDKTEVIITNRGAFSLYVTLLNMESSGTLSILYPLPGEVATWKPLTPGESLRLPVAFASPQREGRKEEGIEGFKAIGTTEKIDASYLASMGVERGERTGSSPFSQALGSLLGRTGVHRGEPLTSNDDPGHYVLGSPLWVRVMPATL
jgi:hypothetical protein